MNQDEVDSQLSAMFDGELPAAECELLSRRIDRAEELRSRWSRYALIGAAMRSEPVATARSGFATRVSAALQSGAGVAGRAQSAGAQGGAPKSRRLLQSAMAAAMVVAVAGLSITMLRNSTLNASLADQAAVVTAAPAAAPAPVLSAASSAAPETVLAGDGSREPVSYVTPASKPGTSGALRTELADYIVAHSEYSSPLMRRSLLSALVSESAADSASGSADGTAQPGEVDASSASASPRH